MNEEWKAIPDTNGSYEVSNLGRVRSLDKEVGHRWGGKAVKKGKVLALKKDKDGYVFVGLSLSGVTRNAKVHRLVAQAFVDGPELPEVNHRDLNKENNHWGNLEWSSRKGNQEHASGEGLFTATTNPKRAKKLTPELAAEIRSARQDGMTYAAIADSFGISAPTALKVVRGDIW